MRFNECECGYTCISCAERPPDFDTPDGPFCAQCIGNGQYSSDTEVVERDVTEHIHVGVRRDA